MQRPPAYLTLPSSALVRVDVLRRLLTIPSTGPSTYSNTASTCNLQLRLRLVFFPPCLALHPRSQPSRNPHLYMHAVQRRGFGTMEGPLLPRAIRWITYWHVSSVLAMAAAGRAAITSSPCVPAMPAARLPQRPCHPGSIAFEDGQAPVLHASVLLSGTPPSCTPITPTLTP